MSAGDVKAGGAFVELFVKGFAPAQAQIQQFGQSFVKVGAGIAAAGAAIVGPMAAAVQQFVTVGSSIDDVAGRTGVARTELAQLGYAAEQSGSSLGAVEKAIQFARKNGDNRSFDEIAASIAAIKDPAERTRAAFAAWGKSGVELIPMLNELQALKAEGKSIFGGISEEDFKNAGALGDMIDKIKKQFQTISLTVGAALAPALLRIGSVVSSIVQPVVKWANENRDLIVTVGAIGVGLVAVGTALATIGTGMILIGPAIGAVASVLALVLNPVVLITAAVVAGVVAWARWSESGRAAVQAVMGFFGPLLSTARAAIRGIVDALAGGQITLAGQIAVKSLQLVFLQGVQAIATSIGGVLGDLFSTIGNKLIRGDLAGAWDTVVQSMALSWDTFVAGILRVFADAVNQVQQMWSRAMAGVSIGLGVMSVGLRSKGADALADVLDLAARGLETTTKPITAGLTVASAAASTAAVIAQRKAQEAAVEFGTALETGASATGKSITQLAIELLALSKQAADAKAEFAKPDRLAIPALAGADGVEGGGGELRSSVATSAAGKVALTFGGGPQEGIRELIRVGMNAVQIGIIQNRLLERIERKVGNGIFRE